MKKVNFFRYNPIYSIICFMWLRLNRNIQFLHDNIGREVDLSDSKQYKIFLEIAVLDEKKVRKEGKAIFKIIFHSAKIPVEKIINRTKFTIPFFSGLPGFCHKQFMVNGEDKKFSGRYEWETVEMAQKYARSFALKFMQNRSNPFPVSYEIINKETNEIVEARELKI